MADWKAVCLQTVRDNGWKLCTWDTICKVIQSAIDGYCGLNMLAPGTPVPQAENGQLCYCCCSCFAYNTPIEVRPNEFVYIQDIKTGDTVLTAGLDLNWEERQMTYSGGLGPDLTFDFMYYVRYEYEDDGEAGRSMITTADHLFLVEPDTGEDRKLKPVQHLIPGDKLVRATGGTSAVKSVNIIQYKGGLHHIYGGDFDGHNLDGHLLNANGIVSSDYIVQLCFSAGQLDPALLVSAPDDPLEVGTPEYAEKFGVGALSDELADQSRLPEGFRPYHPDLINVPKTAKRFLTDKQARQLRRHAHFSPYSNLIALSSVRYVFEVSQAFYPNVTFLVDWNNSLPNGYAWNDWEQRIILITGGLARIRGFSQEGLALVVSQLLAFNGGEKCVGPADYAGAFNYMRQIWKDQLYVTVVLPGIQQVKSIFGLIPNGHAKPDNICLEPPLDCRIQTYEAASSMFPIPSCAVPKASFDLTDATASADLLTVTASFDLELNPPTAESPDNYTIDPGAKVTGARLDPGDATKVILDVAGLNPGSDYVLVVTGVLSRQMLPINADKNSKDFSTQP